MSHSVVPPTRLRVPYITAYDEEAVPYRLTFARDREATDGWRLSYTDAIPLDWMFGVLWSRQGLHRRGQPRWKLVNTLRQRNAMLRLLCQVCGQPAAGPDGRVSWVLADDPGGPATGEGYTNAPPTCRQCVPEALIACPRLRRGAAVYSVGEAEPYGVIANVMGPDPAGAIVVEPNAVIPLDAFHRLEYALAVQLLVALRDLRPIPLLMAA
ncbi:hypothetical protein ACFOY2_01150 [Nonomuraea purpurea]|uniref:Uncharacterized protein n=1 Tax=Nonomuraea purpurea TaxID=1849276 RepID=A0ABV8FVR8_9ACTN